MGGQAESRTEISGVRKPDESNGFIMVALLVSMAVAAVWMAALLPSWRQQVTREKEAELIFRGEAIARAIYLYRQKNNQALPPSLDVLVSQRYLRKKYLDPITGKDFAAVGGATALPGRAGGVGSIGGGVGGGAAGSPGLGGAPGQASGLQGGIIGVRSTSQDESIRIYNNQQVYSQWQFDFTLEQQRAGGGVVAGGGNVPGGGARGGRQGPGGGVETPPIGTGNPRGGGPAGPGGVGGRGGGLGPAPGGLPQGPGFGGLPGGARGR